jgi:phosphatidylglycerol:prolipoprotein diacylglycerol transferase
MTLGEFWTFLGFLTGALVLWMEARRRKIATQGMRLVALCGVAGGVLGAKLTQWIVSDGAGLTPTTFLDPRNGGKSLLGGLIFGWISVAIAKRRLGIIRSTGDLWAVALPAGEAVGRIGCFFNACCFGTAWSGTGAVFQHGAWRHATQIYSALGAGILFAVLWKLRDKLPREGDLFRLYLGLYGLSRFVIENFRERDIALAGLSGVQLICLCALIYAARSFGKSLIPSQKAPVL